MWCGVAFTSFTLGSRWPCPPALSLPTPGCVVSVGGAPGAGSSPVTAPVLTQTLGQILMEHSAPASWRNVGDSWAPGLPSSFPLLSLAPLHTHTPCETPNLSTASIRDALPCGSFVHPPSAPTDPREDQCSPSLGAPSPGLLLTHYPPLPSGTPGPPQTDVHLSQAHMGNQTRKLFLAAPSALVSVDGYGDIASQLGELPGGGAGNRDLCGRAQ